MVYIFLVSLERKSQQIMKIYTSYFGNLRKLSQAGIIPVSIARWSPKWFEGIKYGTVAPLPDMLKGDITREQYIEQYNRRVLARLDPARVVKELTIFTGDRDCALLCYEKPGDFCHRHLFAEWMTRETGLETTEFGVEEDKPKETEIIEPSLWD